MKSGLAIYTIDLQAMTAFYVIVFGFKTCDSDDSYTALVFKMDLSWFYFRRLKNL